ncbi:MAG: hypothetical protein LKF87_10510 [Clostridium tyrobutyricum]|jgi:TRAP-type C4-dicarboxylate transport system permease large subunit|uniref:hypothetical protein n=1 Tax=Clostridium tyrobutyricum TaxID=1519 RepID=UPI0024329E4C|nr:hypothetical protein [Clostridium tyrobutyricum]MCH4200301.1 hypothetical protein [Clostridium tyrobutyricum]MCH4237485.1 hypothetical protein [Clostridium tyrobutyricum]MCH4259381.1 hypothetical protein [Clostridium tyrobutyricum]MCI1238437.1 hypothetical protein [Clostridium tyrobutyricum]MCI1653297.1 hypothetical protein [Clostridium tyrobutyricum]
MNIILTNLHFIYLVFIIIIIVAMIMKRDISLICIMGIFTLGIFGTASVSKSLIGIFNSLVYATKELMPTIFIISIITAMSNVLVTSGINKEMVKPFGKIIKSPASAYWVIGIVMMALSWLFWPSPAVALIGALFLPIAKKVGLPAIGAAVAMNLFGHGIALSSDFIIQAAPKLTADAAGIPVSKVISASVPLTIVMGAVTTITAFYMLRKDMKRGKINTDFDLEDEANEESQMVIPQTFRKTLAAIIIAVFILDIFLMYTYKFQGGDATALIGGTAVFILSIISIIYYKKASLEKITDNIVAGLQFGFKIFGVVIPIAAFFYLGDSAFGEIFGNILPKHSQGIVNDLGVALSSIVPLNPFVASGTLTAVGAITGLDGSGFSGISLVGSIAHMFSISLGGGIDVLTALGQIAAIYVGGGTIIPWAVIPVAAICKVDAFELTKRNLIPVVIGLVVTTIFAVFLM